MGRMSLTATTSGTPPTGAPVVAPRLTPLARPLSKPTLSADQATLRPTPRGPQSGLPAVRLAAPTFDINAIPGARLPDLRPARTWQPGSTTMTGVAANAVINATYHRQCAEMTAFLPGPPLANFMSLAKYGSREAGSQIRDLETAMVATQTLTACDDLPKNGWRAVKAMAAVIRSDDNLARGYATFKAVAKDAWQNAHPASGAGPVGHVAGTIGRLTNVAIGMQAAPGLLRNALVEGNTAIYQNIGQSFQLFLVAEKQGKDGVTALKSAIGAGQLEDPLGYIIDAFKLYQQARQTGQAAMDPATPPAERQTLLAQRKSQVLRANLLLATEEQAWPVETATTWHNPRIQAIMGSMGPTMYLTIGGNDRVKLLPRGGNWTDFSTRMGFIDVTKRANRPADAIRVTMPWAPGEVKYYLPDPTQKGTITAIFTDNLEGAAADRQRLNAPRPIAPR